MSSPIRCRGPWKIHKRASEPDRWLDEMGFFRKHTARDSSCLFRAVSENIFNTQRYFHKVRLDCVNFMASKRHLFEGSLNCPFENYLKEMSNPSEWGGLIEISAMSHLYRRDFVIFEANKGPQTKICNGYGNTIYLFYSPEAKHFDAVYTKEFINASSFCQSLVYEVLYDGVYQLKDLSYAVDKMLHDKVPSNHIEYFMSENVERRKKQKERAKIYIEAPSEEDKDKNNNALALKCKHHTEDIDRASLLKESLSIFVFNRSLIQLENVCMNCLNVNSAKDLLDNGITPFPYKVAKALDPDIYRNIEFDVWSELRRELRYGARYSDGTTLQVGVKCLCKLQSDQVVPYHCHIQEMRPEGGPCLVFIEELGEKRVVNYDQLEPLPIEEIRPWAPPYRYSRANSQLLNLSQMLQQLGNITRKQGLNKSRSKSKVEDPKSPEKAKEPVTMDWAEDELEMPQCNYTYPLYQHVDYVNFEPIPIDVEALPVMVDCRPAGAPPQELAHSNGASPENNQASGGAGDMGTGLPPGSQAVAARASTPATTNAIATYTAGMSPAGAMPVPYSNCAPYCGVKGIVWCAPQSPPPHALPHALPAPHPPHPALPPPTQPINPHVLKSVQANGADLPMNDIATLRYFFNLGVECMWSCYGPPPHHGPIRHFAARDLAQEMAGMSLHERPNMGPGDPAHKQRPPGDKPPLAGQGRGNGQRPLVGPRFKRNNGHEGSQNNGNNHNRHNNMSNRGHNNRRNSHPDGRAQHYGGAAGAAAGGEECAEAVVPLPYVPYPPPVYPVPYYPVEHDPAMMGMMGGMSYVEYGESVEYGLQHYYPPYPVLPPPHLEHK
ncbi:deubiquitinase otu-like [Epargyreus clarus]|uniref:deubiquitinase otu-like n=1 Tax=Epargyreus clarus TaxID=520877 RepID=UPI003C2E9F68